MEDDLYLTRYQDWQLWPVFAIYTRWEYYDAGDYPNDHETSQPNGEDLDVPGPGRGSLCNTTGTGAGPSAWLLALALVLGWIATRRHFGTRR